jgi:uncharacterized protein
MIFLIIVPILLFILLGVGYYFARLVIYPKISPYKETYKLAVEWGWLVEEEYTPWPKEELTIRSPHGYDLFAIYHEVPGARKTVVISHGITFSLYGMVKYAPLFYKRGFNVLLYDLRNHGRSGGKNTTFGKFEKDDLKTVVDWAFERLGPGGVVGTFGESLGAVTTLQHAAIDPRIAFAIADCPFGRLSDLLAYRLKLEYRLPPFPLLNVADLWSGALSGMRFGEIAPLSGISAIETPIFFIHGKEDAYIPPRMTIDLYRAKTKGHRKLYLAPDADHAQCVVKNPVEYDQKLGEFLREIHLEESN